MGNKISKKEKILCKNNYISYNNTTSDYSKTLNLKFTESKYCNKIYIEYLLINLHNKLENTGVDNEYIYYKVTMYSKQAYEECLQLIKKNSEVLKIVKR